MACDPRIHYKIFKCLGKNIIEGIDNHICVAKMGMQDMVDDMKFVLGNKGSRESISGTMDIGGITSIKTCFGTN